MKRLTLTAGERLLIDRRRSRLTQREAAKAWDVSRYQYRIWEVRSEDPPSVELGLIWNHERCYLLRIRAGIEQKDLAVKLGVSRWWLCRMEYGEAPIDALVEWWNRKAA